LALKKSEKRLLKILGVVVVGAVIFELLGSSGKHKSAVKAPPKNSLLSAPFVKSKSNAAVSKPSISPRVRYNTWGRDPFYDSGSYGSGSSSASGKKGEKSKPPVLKGIFWKQGRAYVLIDSSILREGEEKKGLMVEKIKGTEVLCRKGKRLFTLRWRESP